MAASTNGRWLGRISLGATPKPLDTFESKRKDMSMCGVVTVVLCSLPFLPGVALAQGAPAASTPSVATAVSNVQAFYNQVTTFSATFEQTYLAKAYKQTRTSHGNVVFSKPGMMSWQYSNPQSTRIVSNGTTLWVYEPTNKQVFVQAMGQSQYSALSFLTGQGSFSAQCNFTIYPGAQLQYHGGFVLLCDPKQPTSAYTKDLFYVDAGTSQVRRVLILDRQGNRNRFDFNNVVVNPPVSPQQFAFTPPPGAAVIGAGASTTNPPTSSMAPTSPRGTATSTSPPPPPTHAP